MDFFSHFLDDEKKINTIWDFLTFDIFDQIIKLTFPRFNVQSPALKTAGDFL